MNFRLLLCGMIATVNGLAYGMELEESLKGRYLYSQWECLTVTNYSHVVTNWSLPALTLPTNGLPISACCFDEGDDVELIVQTADDTLFRISTWARPSVRAAHLAVIQDFSRMTSLLRFTQVSNFIGDVSFYQNYGSSGDCLVFTRNNVFVRVDSRLPSHSSTNIARQIDASILRASGVEVE